MAVLLLQAAATAVLVGVVWIVQLVHYPLFALVARRSFERFHAEHSRRITWIVAPAMLLEAATAAWIAWRPPAGIEPLLGAAGLILVAVTWLSTAFLQVPLHRRLAGGFEPVSHQRLVRTNWVRTVAWTLRLALAFTMIVLAGG